MVLIFGYHIAFWCGLLGAILILLHVPSCSKHWAQKLPFISNSLSKYHKQTLGLATLFAFAHIILDIMGLVFGVWI
jgi:hypothetical protein